MLINLLFLMVLNAQNTSIMTYNIKLDHPKEGVNSWTNRKPFFLNQLKFYEPDILGVQEAMPNQMRDIDSLLVNYNFVGVGRDDGKNMGEYSAIFYNKNKFVVLESATFWLSETPYQVSMGWDASYNRICTYALLKDKMSKKLFWVFNTHLDHIGKLARTESSKLILNKIQQLNTGNLPLILMGDFNLEPETEPIKFIKTELNDSRDISIAAPFGPSGTFNHFKFDTPVNRRYDYIFVNNKISVQKYAVLSDSWDCKYPSDHLPVYILICF